MIERSKTNAGRERGSPLTIQSVERENAMVTSSIPMVTPEEAIKLFKFRSYLDTCTAMEIYRAFIEAGEWGRYDRTYQMNLYVLLATAWNAGRVQGIREERAKRKKRAEAQT